MACHVWQKLTDGTTTLASQASPLINTELLEKLLLLS